MGVKEVHWSPDEQWSDVPGFEGYYWVSDEGRIASRNRLLKPSTSRGYSQVSLSREGQPHVFLLHKIVTHAFLGPRPEGTEVCHRNGDRADPALRNLRYGTRAYNCLDTLRHGRSPALNKTRCKNGHEFTKENTRLRRATPGRRPSRICVECKRIRARKVVS